MLRRRFQGYVGVTQRRLPELPVQANESSWLPMPRANWVVMRSALRVVTRLEEFSPDPESLLTISDQQLIEGDAGTTTMTFTLSRGADRHPPIRFEYETADVTATEGEDYTAVAGVDVISSGESIDIDVPIIGDAVVEGNETFTLRIFAIAWA